MLSVCQLFDAAAFRIAAVLSKNLKQNFKKANFGTAIRHETIGFVSWS